MAIKKEFYDLLEKKFSSSEMFTLDSDATLELVKAGKFSILNRLTLAKNYFLVPKIASEIIGRCHSGELNEMQIKQIQSFVSTCKRNGKLSRIDSKAIEKIMAPLSVLLPRKIVIDIVIGDHDSFVNTLIKKYEAALDYMAEKKRTADYLKLSKEYAEEKSKLLARCLNKLNDRLFMTQLPLKEKDKQRVKEEIKRLLEQLVKSVEGIISSTFKEKKGVKDTLNNIKLRLMTYSTKTYDGDVNAVSQAIANGASFTSFDSDVIFLMMFYSAATVA